jgi:hypothetical protein
VLNWVCVIRTGHFKKLLKEIFGPPILSLEVVFGSRHELLVGVAGFLIAIAVAGHYDNAMGSVLLSLLDALRAFLGAFDGGLGGCGWQLLVVAPALPRMKAAPTTSSLEAC